LDYSLLAHVHVSVPGPRRQPAQIEQLTTRIGEAIAPFAHQVAQLDEIPGIGAIGA
jgi:hypothetical protein